MATTQYTTKQGDRWESIAFLAYGDSNKMADIIAANKSVAISQTLPAGLKINIPILEPEEIETVNPNLLPPWKR